MAFEVRDPAGALRASVAADGTVKARGTVIGFINPDGSAGDAYEESLGPNESVMLFGVHYTR